MIQVKVELWPGGNQQAARQIADIRIESLSDLADVSNLHFVISPSDGPKEVAVTGTPSHEGGRSDVVLRIIEKILLHILHSRRNMGFGP